MKLSKIYNIPVTNSFVDTLATKLLDEYAQSPLELSGVLLLLPNRRACQNMAEAFIRKQGMSPTLLPQMRPIGDIDEDEISISGVNADSLITDTAPAISSLERTLLFMRIILSRPQEFGLEKLSLYQSCFLAHELGKLIDTAILEELDFNNLKTLVPEEYASHWQETLKFLDIITANWPLILSERGFIDASKRKTELIIKQAQLWKQLQTDRHIIIGATTATYPSMQILTQTISKLPHGEVFLYGLDKTLDEKAWACIDETHPQFELKNLLKKLDIERHQISDFVPPLNPKREKLISEIMRPAPQSHTWRELSSTDSAPIDAQGINLINCADNREEALSIALLMRHTIETPEKTATLITPDRKLARRVASELQRWNIKIDDTAGRPLSSTPWGTFMRLIITAATPQAERVAKLSLLKHPLCGLGSNPQDIRNQARNLELQWRMEKDTSDNEILSVLSNKLSPLTKLLQQPQISLSQILKTHIMVAEELSATSSSQGEQILWKGDAGNIGAELISQLLPLSNILCDFAPEEYIGLFDALCSQSTVRTRYGTHPRLKIMGPIEARLTQSDITILGGFNEGTWPQIAGTDPWMSRPMKKDFGFPLPEKSIGIMGLDLSCFMGAKEIYITRSEKVDGTPTLKSRWLMRLETVLKALNIPISQIECNQYLQATSVIDEPTTFTKLLPPAPTPPIKYRPRQLSASNIELLMRDPYSIFAKYILKLKPLKDLSPELTQADFGNLLHQILEEFNNKNPHTFPQDGLSQLLTIGKQKFSSDPRLKDKQSFWWPKFAKMIEHLSSLEQNYRPDIAKINNEIQGSYTISELPYGEFTITATADRVDETKDGEINIIDYKTGKARSTKEVTLGFAPQLPIEGLIAQKGGYPKIKAKNIKKLIYWQLGRKETVIEENIPQILSNTEQNIKELLNIFDFPTTPYICNPNPKRIPEYSDYEHLARIKEWYVNEDDDD
ncbi:MAG: double-strand break repair protein AddB [Alphaproteobacteria bacterium]|nr:double-strand break repair protein AddB [Alphaproteobacteria bacterium]